MLTSLSIKNFKSIHNQEPLNLKNLTVVCGSNSSGKSSIIQAILMISQTLSSRYFKRSVSLNGKLVRLGSFSDILNHAAAVNEKNIEIAMDLEFSEDVPWLDLKSFHFNMAFESVNDREKDRKFDGEFHPEIVKGSVRVVMRGKDEPVEYLKFAMQEGSKANLDLFNVLDIVSASSASMAKDYPEYKIEGVLREDLVPNTLNLVYDNTKRISQSLVPYLIGSQNYLKTVKDEDQVSLSKMEIPRAVLDRMRSLIEAEGEEQTRNFVVPDELLNIFENRDGKERLTSERVRLLLARQSIVLTPDLISIPQGMSSIDIKSWRSIVDRLNDKERKALFDFLIRNREEVQGVWYVNMKKTWAKAKFSLPILNSMNMFASYFLPKNFKYLGPLRNEPQAMYQAFDLSEPTMVGLKGENTAAVLHINKSVKVRYPSPVDSNEGKFSFIYKHETLGFACTEWLSYLGVVTEFRTYDKGKLGYELQVKTTDGDQMQDLTHVGVGVSQILPIVVMALLSDKDDILIFEQPELHLHPKVQSRLTDFFLAISSEHKQCLIETHSEYIINRLRLRIAQSRDQKLIEKTGIIFVGKSQGMSVFRSVDITKFGSIVDWPEDFFDQTDIEVENILLEAVKKKKEIKASAGLKEGK